MKTFLKKLILFAAIFFIIDKLFLGLLYYSGKNELDKRLENVLEGKVNKEVIILGSSRGARNVMASQLQEQTGHSTFNLAYPGSNVEFHEFVLRSLLKFNQKPKLVVLTVDSDNPSEFTPNLSLKYRLDRLYPLVKYDYVLDELANRGEKNKWLAQAFALHRLNKSNFDLSPKKFKPIDTIQPDGSMPISFADKREKWDFYTPEKYDVNKEEPAKVKAFKDIVAMCDKNGIKLLIAFSPNYSDYNAAFEARVRQLAGDKALYMVYDRNNKIYKHKGFYYDREHLMANGAKAFTAEIAAYINANKVLIASK